MRHTCIYAYVHMETVQFNILMFRMSRVFYDVEAYVSCQGYDCILISAQHSCEARWYRGFVDSSLTEKRFSVRDFFIVDEGRIR